MKKLIFLVPTISLACFASTGYDVHILKKGESLSQLLYEKGYSPLYGKDNWVERTIDLNHLTAKSVIEIKEGYPIILPTHKTSPKVIVTKNIVEDQLDLEDIITLRSSSISKKGLLSKAISSHQDVRFEVDYFQNNAELPDSDLTSKENFGLGVKVDGQNNYTIGALDYNYYGSLFVHTHGTSKFNNFENISSAFTPTYTARAGAYIKSPEIPFQFGPSVELEERSRAQQKNDDIVISRDRTAWIGFNFRHNYDVDHLVYSNEIQLNRKILQQSITDSDIFAASSIKLSTGINLTRDYDLSFKYKYTDYENVGIKRENSFGFNLSYNLK